MGRGTAIIPEHLIKYFEVSKPSNKVHIFDRIQGTFQTHKLVEEYVKNSNINNSIYIYETNNRNLFKFLDQSIDFNYNNKLLYVKVNVLGFQPYDPQIPRMAEKEIYIKNKFGNFHKLNIKTPKINLNSESIVLIGCYFDVLKVQNSECKWSYR